MTDVQHDAHRGLLLAPGVRPVCSDFKLLRVLFDK